MTKLPFKQVCDKAKRFYEIAAFFHYAVADGIHRLLFASHTGVRPRIRGTHAENIGGVGAAAASVRQAGPPLLGFSSAAGPRRLGLGRRDGA